MKKKFPQVITSKNGREPYVHKYYMFVCLYVYVCTYMFMYLHMYVRIYVCMHVPA
jgi:hypothetical protein